MDLNKLNVSQLLNILPENMPIYKDSGAWNIYKDETLKKELYHQKTNETLKLFLIRIISDIRKKEDFNERLEIDIAMCISDSFCLLKC